MLCSSQAYDPAWVTSFDRESVKSRQVFGIVNGFWVSMSEKCTVVVELQPQQSFHVGVAVSLSTLLACGLYVTCRLYSKKLDKRQDSSGDTPTESYIRQSIGDNQVSPLSTICLEETHIHRPLQ
jgi:hypothetical protein